MTVQELIDALCKCSLTSEVMILLDDELVEYSTKIVDILEVDSKLNDEVATVYIKHY